MVMATVQPKPPRVVWEAEDKATSGRLRLVTIEKVDTYTGRAKVEHVLESAKTRDAMGAWQWKCIEPDCRETRLAFEELGRRCGCEGDKAEVPG